MAQEPVPASPSSLPSLSMTTCPPAIPRPLIEDIFMYSTPPVVIIGVIGNLLSVVVFQCTKLRRLSTSCYLTALSLSDTGFLLNIFVIWLELMGIPTYNRAVFCKTMIYLSSVCSFLSPWLIVTFTVERFVATCYPLHRAVVCTVARAKAVVAILTLTAALSYIYLFIMADLRPQNRLERDGYVMVNNTTRIPVCRNVTVNKCILKPEYQSAMQVLNLADTVVTLVVPIAVIVILNVMIARAIWHFELVRRRMMITAPSAAVPNDDCNSSSMGGATTSEPTPVVAAVALNSPHRTVSHGHGSKNQRNLRGQYQMKITKMLFVISSVFIGLNAPSYVMRLWGYFSSDQGEQWFQHAQQWCQLWFYLSFAINFLLYCVSGQNFRKSLKSLFRKVTRGAWRRNLSRRNTSTTVTNSAHVWMATAAATPVSGMPTVSSHACLFSSYKSSSGFTEVVLTRNDSV